MFIGSALIVGAFFVATRQPVTQLILEQFLSNLATSQGIYITGNTRGSQDFFATVVLDDVEVRVPNSGIFVTLEKITIHLDWTQLWKMEFQIPKIELGKSNVLVEDMHSESAPVEVWRKLNDEPHLIPLFVREKLYQAIEFIFGNIQYLRAPEVRLVLNLRSGTQMTGGNSFDVFCGGQDFEAYWKADYQIWHPGGTSQKIGHSAHLYSLKADHHRMEFGLTIDAADAAGEAYLTAHLGDYLVGSALRQTGIVAPEGISDFFGKIEWDSSIPAIQLNNVHLHQWLQVFSESPPDWSTVLDADIVFSVEALDSLTLDVLGHISSWSLGLPRYNLGEVLPIIEGESADLAFFVMLHEDVVSIKTGAIQDAYSQFDLQGEVDGKRKIIRLEVLADHFDFKSIKGHIDNIPFSASGWLGGTIFGPLKAPKILARVKLKDFGLNDFNLEYVEGNVQFEAGTLQVTNISANHRGGKISGSYYADFKNDAFTLIDAQTSGASLSALFSLWDDLPAWPESLATAFIKGDVGAEFHLKGAFGREFRDKLLIHYSIYKTSSTLFLGNPVDQLSVHGRYIDRALAADVFDVRFLEGSLKLFGKFDFEQDTIILSGHWDIPQAKINIPTYDEFIRTNLSGKIMLLGPLASFHGEGLLEATEVQFEGRKLPPLRMDIDAAGGNLRVRAPELLEAKQLFAEFSFKDPISFKMASKIRMLPEESAYKPEWLRNLGLTLAAKLKMAGSLFDLETWDGQIQIEEAQARPGGIRLEIKHPVFLRLSGGEWSIKNFTLLDTLGGLYELNGAINPRGYGLTFNSTTQLSVLRSWWGWGGALEELGGQALGVIEIGGVVTKPILSGSFRLFDARLKFDFLKVPILIPELEFSVKENQVRISGHGNVEKGFAAISGNWNLFDDPSDDNWLQCSMKKLPIDWYSWGRGYLSGHLKYIDGISPQVLGRIELSELVIQKEVDFETFINRVENKVYIRSRGDMSDFDWRYDISASTVGARFENTRLLMLLSGDLKIIGTRFYPDLLGTLNVAGGHVFFRGHRYNLDSSKIDFVDGMRTPYLDFSAETRIGEYDIWLKLAGTHRNPQLWVKSDPYLKEEAILSMMTLGVLRPEINRLPELASGAGMELLSWASGFDQVLYRMLPSVLKNRDTIHIDTLKLTSHSTYLEGIELPAILMGIEIANGLKLRFQSTLFNSENLWGRRLELEQRLSEFLRWRIVWESQEGMPIGDAGVDFWYRWEF